MSENPPWGLLAMRPPHLAAAVYGPMQRRALAEIVRVDHDLVATDLHALPEEVLERTEVLLTGWSPPRIDATVIGRMPNLRLAAHAGGGLPGAEVLARHGIPTITQIEANSVPTAEYSVAMILLANKRAFTAQSRYRETRGYLDREVHFLDSGNYESRVGIVGAGHVGRAVLNLLQPYDIELVVADPALDAREVERLGARKVELPELLATSDVVSLHAPEMPSTRHLIGPDQLATMRDGATLINSARGGLIDQAALSTELLSGRIGAVLDVAEPDVLPAENLLFDLPNVVLTPHIAGSMGRELHRLADLNIADIRSHLRSPARVA